MSLSASHQTSLFGIPMAYKDENMPEKGYNAGYTAAHSAVGGLVNLGEKVSDAGYQAVEATERVVQRGNSMIERMFDFIGDSIQRVNDMAKHSPMMKTFVIIMALLASPPVMGFMLFVLTTAATTFSFWALLELGLVGFGLLVMVPIIGTCLLIATGGALFFGGTMLTLRLARMTYNRVMGVGYQMSTGMEGGGFGYGPSGSMRTYGERGQPGQTAGFDASKMGERASVAAQKTQSMLGTAAQTVKETGRGALHGTEDAIGEH